MENTFVEMFAGLGGLGGGLVDAGWIQVGMAECDTKCDACETYTQQITHMSKKFTTICSICQKEKKQLTHQSHTIIHDPLERMWHAYDVTTVTDDDLRSLRRERGPIRALVGGFPCQSFSIAGKRKGFKDTIRGTLFFEIVRWASILEPEYLLLENVEGLLNHDGGRTFETILGTLDEMGYMGEWCVLNSAAYVPQNRERVFIVASPRGTSRRKIFPFGRENQNAIKFVGSLNGKDDFMDVYGVLDTDGIAPTLRTMQGGNRQPKIIVAGQLESDSGGTGKIYDPEGIAPTQLAQHGNAVTKVMVVGNVNPSGNGMNGQVFDADGLAPTLTTNKGEGNKILVNVNQHGLRKTDTSLCLDANYYKGLEANQHRTGVMEPLPVLTPDRLEKRQNGRRFKEPGEPMFTLTAQDKHGVAIPEIQCINPPKEDGAQTYQQDRVYETEGIMTTLSAQLAGRFNIKKGYRIRKLTPLECFRLQSYPDEWLYKLKQAGISDSQLYKMAGNGVTRIVAYEIGRRLLNK